LTVPVGQGDAVTPSRIVFAVYAAAEGLSFFGNSAIQVVLPCPPRRSPTRRSGSVDDTATLAVRTSTPAELEVWNDLPHEAFDVLTAYQGDSAAWRVLGERVEQRLADAVPERRERRR
jgi:hypothetical protein